MIAYPGGKCRLAKTICSFAPQFGGTYCEPFAGRGNVFWTAAGILKYRRWWLNDIGTKPFFDAISKVGNTVEVPYRTRNDWADTREDYYRYKDADSDEARILEPFLTFSGAGYNSGGPRELPVRVWGQKATLRRCEKPLPSCRQRKQS